MVWGETDITGRSIIGWRICVIITDNISGSTFRYITYARKYISINFFNVTIIPFVDDFKSCMDCSGKCISGNIFGIHILLYINCNCTVLVYRIYFFIYSQTPYISILSKKLQIDDIHLWYYILMKWNGIYEYGIKNSNL